jgi:hypothetical protein
LLEGAIILVEQIVQILAIPTHSQLSTLREVSSDSSFKAGRLACNYLQLSLLFLLTHCLIYCMALLEDLACWTETPFLPLQEAFKITSMQAVILPHNET